MTALIPLTVGVIGIAELAWTYHALAALTRQADVLVAATGRARMVTDEMVKPGAVVIDVGINALPDGGIVGDVDFASVREVAGAITPVPGGVGPLTNVVLLKQCVRAAWQVAGEKKKFQTDALEPATR